MSGIIEWYVNSDELVIVDYNIEFKKVVGCIGINCMGIDLFDLINFFCVSDYDLVFVGLNLIVDVGIIFILVLIMVLSVNFSVLMVMVGGVVVSSILMISI